VGVAHTHFILSHFKVLQPVAVFSRRTISHYETENLSFAVSQGQKAIKSYQNGGKQGEIGDYV